MKNIFCLDSIAKVGTDVFSSEFSLVKEMDLAQGIMVRSSSMHEMHFSDHLLAIARAGAGVNNIPLDACAEKGIVVFNTPGANANGVKELAICGMLLAARDIVDGIAWTRGIADHEAIVKDVEKGKKSFAGSELKGKTLGVIGLGAIGAGVANMGASLGMHVLGYDPFITVNSAWQLSRRVEHCTDIGRIFAEADYITLHVPLTEKTKNLICAESIEKMKDHAVILNFSRDALVDDGAMEAALAGGKIHRYVTDFPNAKTANMKGCIAIPHLGASTSESEDNCAVMAAEELMDYIEHGNIRNSVNFPNCDMGICQTVSRIAVHHRNIPNMIGQISAKIADLGVNIEDMTNKSKDKYAYTMLDISSHLSDEAAAKLAEIDGVLKVRIVR